MRVTILLFARLRDLAGGAEIAREVPDGATLRGVWDQLAREFPAIVPYGSSVSAAVNAEYARWHDAVRDGDEIAFLPPVSGGSR